MTTTAFTDAEPFVSQISASVTARLASDLARAGAPRALTPEDVWDVEALLADIEEEVREICAALGSSAPMNDWSVDGIGPEWRGFTDVYVKLPWVTCTWGCTPAADGGYIPCPEHADEYRTA